MAVHHSELFREFLLNSNFQFNLIPEFELNLDGGSKQDSEVQSEVECKEVELKLIEIHLKKTISCSKVLGKKYEGLLDRQTDR